MKVPLDSYSLRARLFPAILVVLPAITGAATWLPFNSFAWKTLAAFGALAAFAVLLSHLARDMGKRKEPALFQLWDGPPSTRFLRHRDATLPQATRDRYRSRLAVLVPGIELPSIRSENARPHVADSIYASCNDWLREKTRDREKFRLLFEENVGYGFRRNLWAMKPAATLLAAVSTLAAGSRIAFEFLAAKELSIDAVVSLVIGVSMLVWWLFRIRPEWVAQSADAYAQRLLAACDEL